MTFRMALKQIRRLAPETENTFRTICRNRHCHPVGSGRYMTSRSTKNCPWKARNADITGI